MIRNLKALGIALVAVFALSAVAASAASAQQGMLTAEESVTLTGSEITNESEYLEAFLSKVKCPGSTYVGHEIGSTTARVPSGATEATITPKYKQVSGGKINCKAAGAFPATVDMNSCHYAVTLGQTTGGGETYGVTFDVTCETAGDAVEVTLYTTEAEDPSTPFCTLKVDPTLNQNLAGGHATNVAGGHINLTGEVEGIHVSRTNHGAHGLLCPNATTTAAAKFKLNATVSGDNAAGATIPISISHN